MRLGLLSDTHGNLAFLEEAARRLLDEMGAELLVHLGDRYEDAEQLAGLAAPFLRVPGLYGPAFHDPAVDRAAVRTVEGRVFVAVHDETGLDPALRRRADVVAAGHTHHAAFRVEDGTVLVNPGHLKRPVDRGEPAGFGLLDLRAEGAAFTVHRLQGDSIRLGEHRFAR